MAAMSNDSRHTRRSAGEAELSERDIFREPFPLANSTTNGADLARCDVAAFRLEGGDIPMSYYETDLVERAVNAYFRYPKESRPGRVDQPANNSHEDEIDGRVYVHLVNCNGTLAVYSQRPDGNLRRLKRCPKAVETCCYC